VVATEHHFVRVGERVYTDLAFGHDYWKKYLEVFDEVHVLARVGCAETTRDDRLRADGPGVYFIPVPDYRGPWQLLKMWPGVFRAAMKAVRFGDCFLLRSGIICTVLWLWLVLLGRPYAREVPGETGKATLAFVGDRHPLAMPIIAGILEQLCAIQLRGAFCASYVSRSVRRRYPTSDPSGEFVFSDVQLTEDLMTTPRTIEDFRHTPMRILSVGRLEREKGHRFLIDAADQLRRDHPDGWHIRIVGPGSQLEPLRQQVRSLRLENYVEVLGPVKYGQELFGHYDWADLFVLPSLTEGMPRALIEAMARGLPAIGSRTGGIVELLSAPQLVTPGRGDLLKQAIAKRIGDTEALARFSQENYNKAVREYGMEELRRRERAFWKAMLDGPHGKKST
jgi:glycosyltransferase involved in cell wall biosynthesis